jgi:hypothetical protein
MKKIAFAVFIVVCFALMAAAQNKADWVKFTSSDGLYTVSMPIKPELKEQEGTAKTGEKSRQYLAQAIAGTNVYMVGYFDIGENMTFSLDNARDGAVKAISGNLLKESSISLGGSPGRQLTVGATYNGIDFFDHVRIYQVSRRVYFLQHIFPKEEDGSANNEKTDKFFDSFKVDK